MPEKKTMERARRDKREGKSPSTQAGEFVREEVEHVREGKHGARSAKQAIAIGLSKARKAGIDIPDKSAAGKSASRRKPAAKKAATKSGAARKPSSETTATRKRAATKALKKEGHAAASKQALSRQTHKAASKRTAADRTAAAKKAARTKGAAGRSAAAKKAARTRARNKAQAS